MKHGKIKFNGTVRYVSLSPHGDPEGVVLEDNTFVKLPPHSVLNKSAIKKGAEVSGSGELLGEEPNRVVHHAELRLGDKVVADDSQKDEREDLKEKHKAEMKKREKAKEEAFSFQGKVVAVATKPKGEVDRIILQDGTSIHVPKEVELWKEDFTIGATVKGKGQARRYGEGCFVKAESIESI